MVSQSRTTAILKEVAVVQTGFNPRGKIIENPDGDASILQPKDIKHGEFVQATRIDLVKSNVNDNHLLNPGDVLFSCKGSNLGAIVFDLRPGRFIASSSFHVIRIYNPSISSKFLAWCLNHSDTMQMLNKRTSGTLLRSISIKLMNQIPIPIVPKNTQQAAMELHDLRVEEARLIRQRETKADMLTILQIEKLILQ